VKSIRTSIAIRLGCAVLLSAAACSVSRAPQTRPQPQPAPAGLAHASRVVIVLVDGLRPDAITGDDAPFLHSRLERCAYSLEAQTVRPSVTLPSHASMISGLDPKDHKVTWNSYWPERGYLRAPTIFDAAHEAGLATALFGGKRKLVQLAKPDTIDVVSSPDRPGAEVMGEALDYLARPRPGLVLIHLPDADAAGHRHGWMSREQLDAIRELDGELRRLFETLEGQEESWAVIVTSDHGGHGTHHSAATPVDTTIPWILCGGGVEPRELPPLSITATARVALETLGLPTELKPHRE
jgi:predicted AlkP superfamily pyrophosphatase or phosphodiesterase